MPNAGILFSDTAMFFLPILTSLVVSFICALASIPLARWLGLVDVPGTAPHKLHTKTMPLAGGIALVLSLLVSGLIFGTWQTPEVAATLVAGTLIFAFGLWDDFSSLKPLWKFFGQVLAAILLIRLGVAVRIFESPEFFFQLSPRLALYLDWLLTILWVVGITNAFNFVDSMDGLAVGLAGVSAAFFMLVTLDAGQPALSLHSAILLGSCFALYYFNASPARLFLGDSGAQTLGFVLAVLSIVYQPRGAFQTSSWFVTILLLGMPIFDMTLVVVSRLRRKRAVHIAARDHTYHRLLKLNLDSNRAVLLMQMVSLFLSCLAAISLSQTPLIANSIFLFVVLVGLAAIVYLDQRKRWP